MEPYREKIFPRLISSRPAHEVAYINSLFSLANPGSEAIKGSDVVAFFKRSNVELVSSKLKSSPNL